MTQVKVTLRAAQETGSETSDHLNEQLDTLKEKLQKRNIMDLKAKLANISAELDKAVRIQWTGLKHIQNTISANVQTQIALAELAQKLENKQYTDIRDAVRTSDSNRKKTIYTPAALFLILESMGGTWCMYLKFVMDKRQIRTWDLYREDRDLVLHQMLYDLTMWFSISNTPKKTRYMSSHVQAFIDTFQLENNELTDGTVPSSDDDDTDEDLTADTVPTNSVTPQQPDPDAPATTPLNPAAATTYTRTSVPSSGNRTSVRRPGRNQPPASPPAANITHVLPHLLEPVQHVPQRLLPHRQHSKHHDHQLAQTWGVPIFFFVLFSIFL